MIPRRASSLSLLAAVLLYAGVPSDRTSQDDEIKIEFDHHRMKYVTQRHLEHIRATLRRMVSRDELPLTRVIIRVPGEVAATLPVIRDRTYSIRRIVFMHASDWPSWIGSEMGEPGAGVSWKSSRCNIVCRVFDLEGETVEIPVCDEMSFIETRRVLMAIRHGRVAIHPTCQDRGRPELGQVIQVRREKKGELGIWTRTDPHHRWGPIFHGALRKGIFEVRAYGHWDS